MTEFHLSNECTLGLMPYSSIHRLLGEEITAPELANQNPCAELYIEVDNPHEYHGRSLISGGTELSGIKKRDWGHTVGYSKDIDGHIIAFAKASDD
ncbi:glyoxalase [Thaumasiovibrio subtropicus]|nr:glyoxalase [Thaumasiovibrio subtropicus]